MARQADTNATIALQEFAVGSRYQATASEDCNRLRKPSVPIVTC
jgi:hypothetical protein